MLSLGGIEWLLESTSAIVARAFVMSIMLGLLWITNFGSPMTVRVVLACVVISICWPYLLSLVSIPLRWLMTITYWIVIFYWNLSLAMATILLCQLFNHHQQNEKVCFTICAS